MNIQPVTRYVNAHDAIDWLCRAFGFERQAVHQAPDGSIVHAELRLDGGVFGLSSAGPEQPDNVWTTVRTGLYVTVEDTDAVHARAVAAGARIAMSLRTTNYGSRDFSAWDNEGLLWGFGTYAMGDASTRPALFPAVRYRAGRNATAFLAETFGLETGLKVDSGDDLTYAELWNGRGVVSVDAGPDPHGCWLDRRQCTCVVVADPDAHHARALAGKARVVRAPYDTPYGARGYMVQDIEGFLWSFSTYQPSR
jgi:uncharacterized glyoxalase superfamily protein PhnB